MAREIKFRAWDGDRMHSWQDLEREGRRGDFYALLDMNHDDHPVMQYTGLKDANGVEIYEGDVLAFSYFDDDLKDLRQEGEVFWSEGWGAVGLRKTGFLHIPFCDKAGHQGITDFVVIGNIYENPELLK